MARRHFHNSCATGSLQDRGAQLWSWQPTGSREVLFSAHNAASMHEAHAGIPLCAPWFGQGRDEVEVPHAHGLVRWLDWSLVDHHSTCDCDRVAFELEHEALMHIAGAENYPPDLHYRFEARLGKELHVALTISSPTTDTVVDLAFHTYLSLSDVRRARVSGLHGAQTRCGDRWGRQDGDLTVTEACDLIFFDALQSGRELRVFDTDRTISITTHGATDVIVWNPGPPRRGAETPFVDDEWTRMLCVEVGNVQRNAVKLKAGSCHTLAMTLRVS